MSGIKDTKYAPVSFFCESCEEDLHNIRARRCGDEGEQLWRSACPVCGRELRRLINQAKYDRYFLLSPFVAREQRKYHNDMLHPNSYGFRTLYGDVSANTYKEMEEEAQKEWRRNQIINGPSKSWVSV